MAEIDNQECLGKNLIPLYLNLKSKLIVIFGGGKVGERKAILFSQYSHVQVVSRSFTTNLIEESQKGTLELIRADLYEDYTRYLQGAFIVVPATNDSDLNRDIEKKANDLGIMINKVDGIGDIVVPSIVRRDPVTIAISTESPALSKFMRLKLEKYLREDYQGMARLLGHIRRELKESVPLQSNRSKIVWNILEDKEVWRLLNESYEKAYMRAREHAMPDERDCLNAGYPSQGLH